MALVYILQVESLLQDGDRRRCRAFLDQRQREKTDRRRPGPERARSLGAEILLQYAADRYLRGQEKGEAPGLGGERVSQTQWLELSLEEILEALGETARQERRRTAPEEFWKETLPGARELSREKNRGGNPEEPEGTPCLGRELDTVTEAGGKPRFARLDLPYSVSHSGMYAVVAVDRGRVGLDLQRMGSAAPVRQERLVERFFAGQEKEAYFSLPSRQERERLFYRMWCRKEALGKLLGGGLTREVLEGNVLGAGGEDRFGSPYIWEDYEGLEGYGASLCRRPG